jgi:NADH-quinone oxidoreductase subunit C
MPWEGPEYRLPGDEKAEPEAPGAPSPAPASTTPTQVKAVSASEKRDAAKPYATDNEDRTLAGAAEAAAEARKPAAAKAESAGGKTVDAAPPEPGKKQ